MTDYSPYHHVYDRNGDLIQTFTSAVWYDTATPAQWCIKRLKELAVLLERSSFRIESDGIEYHVESTEEFREWIDSIFCKDIPWSFSGAINDD